MIPRRGQSLASTPTDAQPIGTLRSILLGLMLLTMVGLVAELFLLEHTESTAQWIPFVAIAAGLAAVVMVVGRTNARRIRLFQGTMVVLVAAGLVGIVLHLRGNLEFEREMEPEASGFTLWWEALRGATPAMAPGALAQLGLLGLAFTYRHPALGGKGSSGRG